MYIFVAFFDTNAKEKYVLKDKYFEQFKNVFADYKDMLKKADGCAAYFAGKDNSDKTAYSLTVKKYEIKENSIIFYFGNAKKLDIKSGFLREALRGVAIKNKWADEKNLPPLLCLLTDKEYKDIIDTANSLEKMNSLMQSKDYKGVCMMYAPLGKVKDNKNVWNNASILYLLGICCSKLSITLLIKAKEEKKLETAAQYRQFAEKFLERGAQLEPDNARCATALAYRYYSNVHELTRPGERRDSNLEYEIKKANEWLSRALEIYPDSIKNNYRKGKLIIEKQAPHLLFAKKSFSPREAALIREIRQVGEEHLARAVILYEEEKDEKRIKNNVREYAKALFVLGGHYLNDAPLPIHEYFLSIIAGKKYKAQIKQITKLNLASAKECFEKCLKAEAEFSLEADIDAAELAAKDKEWARSPAMKLYRLGCVYSDMAFAELAGGDKQKSKELCAKAIKFLSGAKKVSDNIKDKKTNTWHISEKIAWVYIFEKKYERAAKLLVRSRTGYVVNTYAVALMLSGTKENMAKAMAALESAAGAKNNLAADLSKILLCYTLAKSGKEYKTITKKLSSKNQKLADILQVEHKLL